MLAGKHTDLFSCWFSPFPSSRINLPNQRYPLIGNRKPIFLVAAHSSCHLLAPRQLLGAVGASAKANSLSKRCSGEAFSSAGAFGNGELRAGSGCGPSPLLPTTWRSGPSHGLDAGAMLRLKGLLTLPRALQCRLCLPPCWDPFPLGGTLREGSTVTLISPWVVESFPKTLGFSLLLTILYQVHPGGTMVGAEAAPHKLLPFSLLSAAYERAVHIAPFVIPQTPGGDRGCVGTSMRVG